VKRYRVKLQPEVSALTIEVLAETGQQAEQAAKKQVASLVSLLAISVRELKQGER
jgi:hypothetical protein